VVRAFGCCVGGGAACTFISCRSQATPSHQGVQVASWSGSRHADLNQDTDETNWDSASWRETSSPELTSIWPLLSTPLRKLFEYFPHARSDRRDRPKHCLTVEYSGISESRPNVNYCHVEEPPVTSATIGRINKRGSPIRYRDAENRLDWRPNGVMASRPAKIEYLRSIKWTEAAQHAAGDW